MRKRFDTDYVVIDQPDARRAAREAASSPEDTRLLEAFLKTPVQNDPAQLTPLQERMGMWAEASKSGSSGSA